MKNAHLLFDKIIQQGATPKSEQFKFEALLKELSKQTLKVSKHVYDIKTVK